MYREDCFSRVEDLYPPLVGINTVDEQPCCYNNVVTRPDWRPPYSFPRLVIGQGRVVANSTPGSPSGLNRSSLFHNHSSLASLLPKAYARPPDTMFAAQRPNVRPLTAPLAPNLLEKACFLLLATTKYAALHAEVTPAESTGKPFRFRYEEKSRTGTNSIGSFCKGRKCWAVMRVASAVGGTEDSVGESVSGCVFGGRARREKRTAPCAHVSEDTLFGFGRLVGSWHWHVGQCVNWSVCGIGRKGGGNVVRNML
jgi:hypothetical protein